MTALTLTRKGIQVDLDVHGALTVRKSEKEKKLAQAGKAREVSYSEVIRDLLPELKKV
jgi:predicted CopG family antitoxin